MERLAYVNTMAQTDATVAKPRDATSAAVTAATDGYNATTEWIFNVTTEEASVLPDVMKFNRDSMLAVIVYSILFCFSATGNVMVFITMFRNRHRKLRVNRLIMHLSVADMIVTFIMMPMEIGWHVTVYWAAGDIMCRIGMFFRTFGFYLSSFILVVISLDRYFAIAQPLNLAVANTRSSLMLGTAWVSAMLASLPQSFIFHVARHPQYPWFTQCVTLNSFPTYTHELLYNLFNLCALYIVPLAVIGVSYGLIVYEISKKSSTGLKDVELNIEFSSSRRHASSRTQSSSQDLLVRQTSINGRNRIRRARARTLKMTVVIVSAYILCWTPYFVMSSWWWADQNSAAKVDEKIQRGLFIFAVSNSCVNPIIYGMFTSTFHREFKSCCRRKNPAPLPAGQRAAMIPMHPRKPRAHQLNGATIRGTAEQRPVAPLSQIPQNTTPDPDSINQCASRQDKSNSNSPRNASEAGSVHSQGSHGRWTAKHRYTRANSEPNQHTKTFCKMGKDAVSSGRITPPHISQGKGHRAGDFDRYSFY